ncbi:MAG: MBL fold metallo-hydrolase [Clostridia bacterium]|nr:MBL fold metallo-hydrolase [Clostridia bacterium]MDD4047234.1 MBL fold metallo-hydrolase [Clostridia bacterium]
MEIVSLVVGMIQANCYLVYDKETLATLVIDPGAEGEKIQEEIEKRHLQVKYIVNTHGHNDHIAANQYLKEVTGAPLLIHEEDAKMLTDASLNLSAYMGRLIDRPVADRFLQEGDVLDIGNISFEIIHTPGHTCGGICLVGEGVCFSGDTLFKGAIGRTDLPGGSFEVLINSINNKLVKLDENIVVYPGHGSSTTIGEEKCSNPYLSKN